MLMLGFVYLIGFVNVNGKQDAVNLVTLFLKEERYSEKVSCSKHRCIDSYS